MRAGDRTQDREESSPLTPSTNGEGGGARGPRGRSKRGVERGGGRAQSNGDESDIQIPAPQAREHRGGSKRLGGAGGGGARSRDQALNQLLDGLRAFDAGSFSDRLQPDGDPLIAEIIATKPAAAWLDQLETAGIPAGPINDISQALADPQSVHRGSRISAGGGALGEVPMVGSPMRIDGERADAPLPPPALGEHGDLLREWVDEAELERLRAAGIVG